MSFKFNFSGDNESTCTKEVDPTIHWLPSQEILPDKQIKDLDNIAIHGKIFTCSDVEIGHVVVNEALQSMGESNLNNCIELAEKEHSDLVTGKYEGGLKIWECTHDLVTYLEEAKDNFSFSNAKVLDLGCGAGILGIYAFMNGAEVTFQDYNKEVIEYVTIPNVLLNSEENREGNIARCKFYCGDWASFNSLLDPSVQFNIILTSETIYNIDNYEKLIDIFLKRLTEDGVAFVAAKSCYFGVGGSTRQFEISLDKCGKLKSEVCWKTTFGVQREIKKVTKNKI